MVSKTKCRTNRDYQLRSVDFLDVSAIRQSADGWKYERKVMAADEIARPGMEAGSGFTLGALWGRVRIRICEWSRWITSPWLDFRFLT